MRGEEKDDNNEHFSKRACERLTFSVKKKNHSKVTALEEKNMLSFQSVM